MSEFDFDILEYETRLASAQKLMQRERLDAILITSEDHFRYFTGFNSPTWANLTRPRYAVLPSQGDIVLIIPTSNIEIARRTSWVRDVRTWISPQPEDDGISLVRDAIRSIPSRYGRVGAELGSESRLTMPVRGFSAAGARDIYQRICRRISLAARAADAKVCGRGGEDAGDWSDRILCI
ncbi:aminopeptidase P family N-terminal domain-containing protein [Mesorhizobium atlanticum]